MVDPYGGLFSRVGRIEGKMVGAPRLLVVQQAVSYTVVMKVVALLRRIGRKLTPPGNRGSLETEYRQPNMDPTHSQSEGSYVAKMNSGGR
jgi:hypothetical protein